MIVDFNWIWKTILIFFVGKFILRIGGRKSISQTTITQTIVMIGIGSLLIQPVSGKGLFTTFFVAALLTLLMIITEYLETKWDFFETFFSGKAVIVIENGEVKFDNLKKIRMTVDRLETRLRQSGISSITDVQYATIEVSGQLGYELKEEKKPLAKEDIELLLSEINNLKHAIRKNRKKQENNNKKKDIFEEIKTKKHEGNRKEP